MIWQNFLGEFLIHFLYYFSALRPHGGNPIKSITREDVQKLFAEAETQGYHVMVLPPPEKPPQNLTGAVVGSSPATGKKLIVKSTHQNPLYSGLPDHDYSPNEFEQLPNGNGWVHIFINLVAFTDKKSKKYDLLIYLKLVQKFILNWP